MLRHTALSSSASRKIYCEFKDELILRIVVINEDCSDSTKNDKERISYLTIISLL